MTKRTIDSILIDMLATNHTEVEAADVGQWRVTPGLDRGDTASVCSRESADGSAHRNSSKIDGH